MPERKDGGPAFPFQLRPTASHDGMTLRDWFAGQALTGLIAGVLTNHMDGQRSCDSFADEAYEFADGMLCSRERFPDED